MCSRTCNPLDNKFKVCVAVECSTTPLTCAYFHALIGRKIWCLDSDQEFLYLSVDLLGLELVGWERLWFVVFCVDCDEYWWERSFLLLFLYVAACKLESIRIPLIIAISFCPIKHNRFIVPHLRTHQPANNEFGKAQKQYFLLHSPPTEYPTTNILVRKINHNIPLISVFDLTN